jgi:hypothetical protein
MQHVAAVGAAQNEVPVILAGMAEPQATQDHQIVLRNEFGWLDQGCFDIAPGLVDCADLAVDAEPRLEQLDLVTLLKARPAQTVGKRVGGRCVCGDSAGRVGPGMGAECLEPPDEFGPHAGLRPSRVFQARDQQRCHVLALKADRAGTIALYPQVVAHVMKLDTHHIGMALRALHFAAQGVVFPVQIGDRIDVIARPGDGPGP